ncbi:MAG: hypothetical protein IJZ08_00795 [Clostridia bacterium]|nr:hypothetical protein [Clostridia bacterium]
MAYKYLYNESTGALHILGFCPHSKIKPVKYKLFDTEQEAYTYAGKRIKACKICESKKENILHSQAK